MAEHTRDPSVDPPASGTPTGYDPESGWAHPTCRRAVVHGVALFNDAAYHDSHDCFEAEWYGYGKGTTESAFLQGLVQVAAGAYKQTLDQPEGRRSLLTTALGYLEDVPDDYYGVDVAALRRDAARAKVDGTAVDDWTITLDGNVPTAADSDYAFAAEID
ncbi:DUF309 domain-containing protein [Halococcoides cellulosivorans]|uniref:DUF309 domain-containing protein n=1 Tax=Halococcoides cellulosivorans TaxID=1679096 RepID=A0A2R4X4V3_9EURY|nr:DUF309 domain-containing protein [Halococcoides cellulosivorans]AWB28723.1 DUF309 domain-containing protein [Halococcoides cellulosivorans]